MDFLIDTTFLIHRWREGTASFEQRFIESHMDSVVGIPWVVKAEFLRGAALSDHPVKEVAVFLGRYQVLWPDEDTLVLYANTYAVLVRNRQMIGPHDLWIAASALRAGIPLLTRNIGEFRRVPGIALEEYAR